MTTDMNRASVVTWLEDKRQHVQLLKHLLNPDDLAWINLERKISVSPSPVIKFKLFISLVERHLFFHLLLATRFPLAYLSATHFREDWLPTIGARTPGRLNY